MSLQDPISNFLNIIKNGYSVRKSEVSLSYSNVAVSILEVMQDQGSIKSFVVDESGQFKKIVVSLQYVDGKASMRTLRRISKPSIRVYEKSSSMPRFKNGLAYGIVSTNKGMMTTEQARNANVGGELICEID